MKIKYIDLIEQTFHFPQEEFQLEKDELTFHGIPLMEMARKYGTPLKFTYLPKISENIQKAKTWFKSAMEKVNYQGSYNYCYCTKSSHFSHIVEQALKNDISIETSSAYDLDIVEFLYTSGQLNRDRYVVCNGYKTDDYLHHIADLINRGFKILPVIDNYQEIDVLNNLIDKEFEIGIRIASEEEPKFEFYTSRLGIGYRNIVPFFRDVIQDHPKIRLKMLHFFINTGINDTAYYWNEFNKCLNVYGKLKEHCDTLDSLNIGGGFPIKNSLAFEYDYAYMVDEIIAQTKIFCEDAGIDDPHIYTEFGSFTVGESGGALFKVLYQKRQNDKEHWNMIDSSFMTTLPDSWAINKRFIMLPLNRWNSDYERVLLGGLTCDSDDYYNSEQHINGIYLPRYNKDNPLYIGFFNTGAYQDTVGGFGGLQHCLIPNPKHIIVDRDEKGELTYRVFSEEQPAASMMKLLGYPTSSKKSNNNVEHGVESK
jgi:arginine decarboxylase